MVSGDEICRGCENLDQKCLSEHRTLPTLNPMVDFLGHPADMLSGRLARINQCTRPIFVVSQDVFYSNHYLNPAPGKPLTTPGPILDRYHTISCQSIEAITAVCPEKDPEVGERMVIFRLGMSIAVLSQPIKYISASLLGPG